MGTYNNISWLASYPKSGNTWVRMFLNAFVTGMPLDLNAAHHFTKLDKDFALLQMMTPLPINQLTQPEQFMYRQAMLLNMLKMSQGRLVLKTHFAKVAVDGSHVIPLQISDCCIYIIRDPRDVVISLSHHLGYSIDETIEFMNNMKQGIIDNKTGTTDLLLTWSDHVKSWTFSNENLETFVVCYEDLLKNPNEIFASILEFLKLTNIDNYEQRFEFALSESHFDKLSEYENKEGFIEKGKSKFFRVGRAEQWKTILNASQVAKIEEDHGAVMEEFGYDRTI